MEKMRLQKAIAQAGIASRRKAENLILEGKVKVNGLTITTLGTTVSEDDDIEVNGKNILFIFYLINQLELSQQLKTIVIERLF